MSGYVGIPTSYTPVEYIESSGTQYIDTGIIPDTTTKLEFDVSIVSGNANVWMPVFGARSYTTSNYAPETYFCLYIHSDSHHLSPNYAGFDPGTGGNTTINFNQRYKLTEDRGQFYIDDVLKSGISTTNTITKGDKTLYLFNNNSAGVTQERGQDVKLYGCKMWDNDVLVKNFIPVLDQDNIACLYEQVEGKLYYNKGTGTFTAGSTTGQPVSIGDKARKIKKGYVGINNVARKIKKGYVGIPSYYTPVEYIESSGTQYIDTGYKPNSNTKIETQFYLSSFVNGSSDTKEGFLYMARNSGSVAQFGCWLVGYYNSAYLIEPRYGTDNKTRMNYLPDSINTITHTPTGFTINGTTQTWSTQTFVGNYNLTIFAGNTGGTISNNSFKSHRLYSFKIYDSNTLVRDFIPVIDQDNVACLYDLVEGKFYYNAGTGTFTAGSSTGEPVSLGSKARLCFTSGPKLPTSTTVLAHFDGTTECAIPAGTNITSGSSFGVGKFDQGYNGGSSEKDYLSGVSSLIYSPRDIISSGYSQTISFWAKPASNNISFSYGSAVAGSQRQQTGYIIKISNNVCTGFLFRETGSGTQYWRTYETSGYNIPVVDGQYHNFVLEMYPGGAKAFVDGHSIGTTNMGSAYGTYEKDLRITGMVDEIMVAREVVYTEEFEPPDEPYSLN